MNVQQIFVCVLTPVIVSAVLPLINILIVKRSRKAEAKFNSNDFVIHMPNLAIWLGIVVLLLVTTILVLLNVFYEIRLIATILVGASLLFVMFAIYAFAREKTVVKYNSILHTPILGRKKSLEFSDIKYINTKLQKGYIDYILIDYDEKRIFTLSSQCVGVGIFLDKAERLGIDIQNID